MTTASSATPFPSLVIRADELVPRGSFAEAQATYLHPDERSVRDLAKGLAEKKVGVVAHFYMDAELQGVLSATPWPQIFIADSLAMADHAVKMAEAGMETIVVLGVDFMSENVRAVLDAAGHSEVEVYRVSSDAIGCSLAESAEQASYTQFLERAAATPSSLHVVYINTSLETKARAQSIVPTITCTSSNVVQTILQAAAQVPEISIFYGPDTYMGGNLQTMFAQFSQLSDAEIRTIHPAHDRGSIQRLLENLHVYQQGTCIVHHMFGAEVVDQVRSAHADAYHTAHLEVPGEMFALAVDAQKAGRGVVGSTSNILGFIADRVKERAARPGEETLSFVLGTEAGMVTAIVKRVQALLREAGRPDLAVEIVFPVSTEAVAQDDVLGLLPGVRGGEGCSTAGGCATCPFMKMNDLESLFTVVDGVGGAKSVALRGYRPRKYTGTIAGRTVADLGSEPILAMRHFQTTGALPDSLIKAVIGGRGRS